MDTGIAARTVSNVAVLDYARPTSVPVQQAVRTELDSGKSVTATAPGDLLRNTLMSGHGDALNRQYVIDPQTREIIYRVMDTRTRQVIRQVPDQALLRMRAYARALAAEQALNNAELLMDVEA